MLQYQNIELEKKEQQLLDSFLESERQIYLSREWDDNQVEAGVIQSEQLWRHEYFSELYCIYKSEDN